MHGRVAAAAGCLLIILLVLSQGANARSAPAPVRGNPADHLLAVPIDEYGYDRARRCRRRATAGALALEAWLTRNVAGASWGIMRCERLSRRNYSLHAEGRAVDWHLDVHDPVERRAARRLIELLLAPDRLGNPHVLARRMGIQEIIWDCGAWWSGAEAMDTYSACVGPSGKRRRHVDDTTAHRDHIHLGLTRAGADRRTTFWMR